MSINLGDSDGSIRMEFGKYEGENIEDIPEDYLEWLLKRSRHTVVIIDAELKRRESGRRKGKPSP